MKLESSAVAIETSGKMEQTEFGISDTGMMMEHMITTIYSDKIGTICREITSNARDAHREVGTPKRPIRIRFPNRFDQTYEVRDWGPGIDPDRMSKVFVQLGSSTKRGDNLQTGGFGIGAKTPWCYTDVFTIRTIAKEKDGVIRRREYSAVKAGQSFTLHEMGSPVVVNFNDPKTPEDDRHTGTSILVPVPEQHNWEAFKEKTIHFTEYWDVRPELCGCDPLPEYPERDEDWAYTGADWKVGNNHRGQIVLVDGIPYPFNPNALDMREDDGRDLYRFAAGGRQSFLLSYGVGELSLSLNREQLQYTDTTKRKIVDRLKTVLAHVRALVEKEIAGAATYWDAHIAFQKTKQTLPGASYITNVKWNGQDVDDTTIGHEGVITINDYTEFGTNADGSTKIRRKGGWNLEINDHTRWVISDEPFVSRLKLVKLMDDHPNIQTIQLIEMNGTDKGLEAWKKACHWDLFAPSVFKMSELAKPEPKKRVRGATVKTKGYEMAGGGRFRDAGTLDLAGGSGVYVLVERRECTDGFSSGDVGNARTALGLSQIHGIPKRFAKHIGPGWKHLKVAVAEAFAAENAKIDLDELNAYIASKDSVIEKVMDKTMAKSLVKALKAGEIEDSTCDLADWIAESDSTNKLAAKYPEGSSDKLILLARLAGKSLQATSKPTKLPVVKALGACQKRYPLVFALAHSWEIQRTWATMEAEFVAYINAKNA